MECFPITCIMECSNSYYRNTGWSYYSTTVLQYYGLWIIDYDTFQTDLYDELEPLLDDNLPANTDEQEHYTNCLVVVKRFSG